MADRFIVWIFEGLWFLPEPLTFMIAFVLWVGLVCSLIYAVARSMEWGFSRLCHDR
jgi:hypothetical protein